MTTEVGSRTDLVFTTGVETEVAKSATVLVGGVADYQQEVQRSSGPPSDVPSEWLVKARLASPECLKGVAPPIAVGFTRQERSWMLPPPDSMLYWEPPYGDLVDGGRAVVFLGEGPEPPVLRVVPTGKGEQGLATLVSDIVRFRALAGSEEKFKAWTGYLASVETDEGKRAALRALCYSGAKWERLQSPIGRLLSDGKVTPPVRGYAFGIVTYYVVKERWDPQTEQAVDSLGETFLREKNADLTVEYLGNLGIILNHCRQARIPEERQAVRDAIVECVKQRKKLALRGGPAADRESEENFTQIRGELLEEPEADDPGRGN
ncbi:MAG: hypothetical protein ACYSUQ_07380 [Planctomycetota bacterium]|jgi:hypothetical protein